MKIRSNVGMGGEWVGEARITTDHAASSHGLPVVVREDGTALGAFEWETSRYEILEATEAELRVMEAAGYPVAGRRVGQ